MPKSKFGPLKISLFFIYVISNILFIYKYSARSSFNPFIASIIYLIFATLLFIVLWRKNEFNITPLVQNWLYFGFIIIGAIGLIILMRHFDPNQIHIGRYPALHDWISRLLAGQFPYESTMRTSGLPFLFVLAMPFYILGDLGYFQIFSFVIFALILFWRFHNSWGSLRCLILLLTSPIFIFEIATRSELISNMIIVIAYLFILEKSYDKKNQPAFILLAICGGLLLSTRAIVALILAAFIFHLFKNDIKRGIVFTVLLIAGYVATLLPFIIWDYSQFMQFSPFAIQASYVPTWLIIIAFAVSIISGILAKRSKAVYVSIAIILFSVVSIAFLMTVIRIGWNDAIVGSGFDISYFGFALPFLMVYLGLDQ